MSTPPPSRGTRAALAVLCAGTLMTIADETIVSVALPTIRSDLGFSGAGLAWVVNAYLIAFGGLLLLAGRLGDLAGRRRMLLAGLALFTGASVLCGLAPSAQWLVAARFAQGAGGALIAATGLGMIVALFPDAAARGRAIGIYAFVGAAGASLGLFAGGVITEALAWRWVFFVNVPVGLAALAAAWRVLAPDRGLGLRGGADVPGAALVVSGLMLAVAAIVGAARPLALGALSAVLLALFAARERTAARPLLPLRLLRSRTVVAANLVLALMVGAMFGFQFLVTLYFQRVLGYGPAAAGLAVLPIAVLIGAVSLGAFPRLAARHGAAAVLAPGLLAIAAGLALLSAAPSDGRYLADVAPSALLFGLGGGLALPALTTLAVSAATPDDAGLASGLVTTSQQVGGALGLAVLASLAAARTDALAAGGAAPADALTAGFGFAWATGAGLVLAALAVALVALRERRAPAPRECPA